MLEVRYRKEVPYSLPVVLSQYYDYEHIEHVHPDTLGSYRLLENEGNRAVYVQEWPPGLGQKLRLARRATSVVEQTFHPPREIRFRFLSGRNRGVEVVTRLEEANGSCMVDETYRIPYAPNWRWLRHLALPSIRKRVDLIWDEDIDVDVCHGGWPGVPQAATDTTTNGAESYLPSADSTPESWVDLCDERELEEGSPKRYDVDFNVASNHLHKNQDAVKEESTRVEILLVRWQAELFAFNNRCPHSGGPLNLGSCTNGQIICPWHGARFSLATGRPTADPGVDSPTETPLLGFEVRAHEGRIQVRQPPIPL